MRTSGGICVLLATCVFGAISAYGQQPGVGVETLTAQDYVEIRRTALYYNLGWDNSARVDGGYIVSRSFTPDSVFLVGPIGSQWNGNLEVAAAAAKAMPGVHHWDSNLVIEPHPQGAKVFRYTLIVNVDDSGKSARMTSGGPLYEIFAHTPEGWLIKHRDHHSATSQRPIEWPRFPGRPLSAPAPTQVSRHAPGEQGSAKATALTAMDYVEIEMLYGWSNIGLDSGAESGKAFARTFTPDGVFEIDGRRVSGHEKLAELAATGPHGLRRWLSNLYVEPSPEGAVGWAYQLHLDFGSGSGGGSANQVTVLEGGLYRDVIVKTAEGWRFKSRIYTPGNTMPESVPAPAPR